METEVKPSINMEAAEKLALYRVKNSGYLTLEFREAATNMAHRNSRKLRTLEVRSNG